LGWSRGYEDDQQGGFDPTTSCAGLICSRDIFKVVTKHLKENETTFLHPKGFDEECDDAWRSLKN
jgi:hypothetical protein